MSDHRLEDVSFGLAIIAAILLVVADGACDDSYKKSCAAIFSVNPAGSDFQSTSAALDAACRKSAEMAQCVNRTAVCDDQNEVRALVSAVTVAFDYICKQNPEEFMEHGQCFHLNAASITAGTDFCQEKAKREVFLAPCTLTSRVLSCAVRSVALCCGKKGAAVYDGMLRVTLSQVLASISNCRLQSDLDVAILPICSGCAKLVLYYGTMLIAIVILFLL